MAEVVPIREKVKEGITVCRLADNKLSVRHGGVKIHILPDRLACSERDIEAAFRAVVEWVHNMELDDMSAETCEDVERETRGDLSRW